MLLYLSMIELPEDQDTFAQIYQKYRCLMLHVADQILRNHQDAEDAVHEAFVAMIQNLDKISEVASPQTKSFVVLIVERKAIDMLRRKKRENWVEINEDVLGVEVPEPGDHGLADAMANLPAHYREVLLMRYDIGLTNQEIARILDITQSGVRKLLGRAKCALEEALRKEGVEL